jgi:autotransporter-associated beta strand protein
MPPTWLSRLVDVRSLAAKGSCRARPCSRFGRLWLEPLERRELLATAIWFGSPSGPQNWNNPNNWLVNGQSAAPSPGDDLVFTDLDFPSNSPRYAPVNDFPADTLFNSITFQTSIFNRYNVTGNQIKLINRPNFQPSLRCVTGDHILALPLDLQGTPPAGQSFASVVVDPGNGDLTLSGSISGASSSALTEVATGNGSLQLAGATPNTFSLFLLNGGNLELNKTPGVDAIPAGGLSFGTNPSLTQAAGTVHFLGNNQINAAASVFLSNNSLLDLNGFSNTINTLELLGDGQVSTGAGVLTLSGNLGMENTNNVNKASRDGLITGHLSLPAGTHEFFNNTNFHLDVAAAIAGAGSVDVTGTGTVVFSFSSNTYTGPTSVSSGILEVGADNALPTSTSLLVKGGSLILGDAQDAFATNQTVGAFTLSSGSVVGVLDGETNAFSTLTLAAASVFNVQSGSISAILAGGAGLTKTGGGTVKLSAMNVYGGPTTVSGGTLELDVNNALPTSTALLINGGSLLLGSGNDSVTFSTNQTVGGFTLSSGSVVGVVGSNGTSTLTSASDFNVQSGSISNVVLAGGVGLTKTGTGTVTLSGSQSKYTGVTTVSGGTLELDVNNALPTSTALLVNGGSLQLGNAQQSLATNQTVGAFTLISGNVVGIRDPHTNALSTLTLAAASVFNVQSGSISAILAGGTELTKTGSGTVKLSAMNVYGGPTTVSSGILELDMDNALPGTTTVVVNGGTLLLASSGEHVQGLTLASGVVASGFTNATLASATTFDVRSGSVSAILAGSNVGLTKTTIGTIILSGNNTYTGPTNVNSGVLIVNGSQPQSPVVLNAGTLTGTGVIGPLTANSGLVTPGPNAPLTVSGSAAFASQATLQFILNGSQLAPLRVTGGINAGDSLLSLVMNSESGPPLNTDLTLILNDGGAPVAGVFRGVLSNGTVPFGVGELIEGALFQDTGGLLFEASYAGGRGHDVIATRASTNLAVVRAMYHSILGRTADKAGAAYWTSLLDHGAGRDVVSSGIWTSTEHRTQVVNQFYTALLGRQGEPGGVAYWVGQLQGGVPEYVVVTQFVTSPEYTASHASAAAFVEGLYNDLLERGQRGVATTGQDVDSFVRVLQSGGATRAQVATFFLGSDEAYSVAVSELSQSFLGRSLSAAETQVFFDIRGTLAGSPTGLSNVFLDSDEYFRNAPPTP